MKDLQKQEFVDAGLFEISIKYSKKSNRIKMDWNINVQGLLISLDLIMQKKKKKVEAAIIEAKEYAAELNDERRMYDVCSGLNSTAVLMDHVNFTVDNTFYHTKQYSRNG